jgi:hypothetical protein
LRGERSININTEDDRSESPLPAFEVDFMSTIPVRPSGLPSTNILNVPQHGNDCGSTQTTGRNPQGHQWSEDSVDLSGTQHSNGGDTQTARMLLLPEGNSNGARFRRLPRLETEKDLVELGLVDALIAPELFARQVELDR